MNQGEMIVSTKLHITKDRILSYAEMSNDFNPIHVDEEFAKTTPFGSTIAHGMLSQNLLWELLIESFGEESLKGLKMDIRFRKPVKVRDTIQAILSIIEIKAASNQPNLNDYLLNVSILNQNNDEVIKGEVHLRS